jgi:hypothetical protein
MMQMNENEQQYDDTNQMQQLLKYEVELHFQLGYDIVSLDGKMLHEIRWMK